MEATSNQSFFMPLSTACELENVFVSKKGNQLKKFQFWMRLETKKNGKIKRKNTKMAKPHIPQSTKVPMSLLVARAMGNIPQFVCFV
jgi:hypothetical protein